MRCEEKYDCDCRGSGRITEQGRKETDWTQTLNGIMARSGTIDGDFLDGRLRRPYRSRWYYALELGASCPVQKRVGARGCYS